MPQANTPPPCGGGASFRLDRLALGYGRNSILWIELRAMSPGSMRTWW